MYLFLLINKFAESEYVGSKTPKCWNFDKAKNNIFTEYILGYQQYINIFYLFNIYS